MKNYTKVVLIVLLVIGFTLVSFPVLAETGCRDAVSAIEKQQKTVSRDMRKIQREIAALRADLGKPGLSEVLGGLGYIFGLFGVAAYVASRRKE